MLHGLYLGLERALGFDRADGGQRSLAGRILAVTFTFHLVCLSWIFFRASNASQAFQILRGIMTWQDGQQLSLVPLYMLLMLIAVQLMKRTVSFGALLLDRPVAARWISYAIILLLIVVFAGSPAPEFIYFQF